jgi:hypothetical protein
MTKNIASKRVAQRPTTTPITRAKAKKLGELYGPNSVGRHYRKCKENGGRLRKPRKAPPIASKISYKISAPGQVPCFACTECSKNGVMIVAKTRFSIRTHCRDKHP